MKQEHRQICESVALSVRENGGRVYYVGGCVRDELMGRPSHDTDIEVHGVSSGKLAEILEKIAPAREVGRSFGKGNKKLR